MSDLTDRLTVLAARLLARVSRRLSRVARRARTRSDALYREHSRHDIERVIGHALPSHHREPRNFADLDPHAFDKLARSLAGAEIYLSEGEARDGAPPDGSAVPPIRWLRAHLPEVAPRAD